MKLKNYNVKNVDITIFTDRVTTFTIGFFLKKKHARFKTLVPSFLKENH